MSHIENLIMNEVRKALENLQRSGVGYINHENTGSICYVVDNKYTMVYVEQLQDSCEDSGE